MRARYDDRGQRVRRDLLMQWRASTNHTFLSARILGASAIAVATALLPQLGPARLWVSVLVLTVVVPAMALIERHGPPRWKNELHGGLDVAALCSAVHFIPGAWTACLVLLALTLASSVTVMSLGAVILVAGAGLGGLVFAALVHDIEGWLVPTVAFATAVPVTTAYSRWFLSQERLATSHLDEMMSSASALFWEAFPDGRFRTVTGDVERLTGLTPDSLVGHSMEELIHPDDHAALHGAFRTLMKEGRVAVRLRVRSHDGWRTFRHLAQRMKDGRGSWRLWGMSLDVNELAEARAAVTRYADIVDRLRDAIVVARLGDRADPRSLVIEEVNPAAREVLGVEADDLIGRHVVDALPWLAESGLFDRIADLEAGRPAAALERLEVGTRTTAQVDVELAQLPDGAIALTLDDVSAQVASERTIRHQADHDELTGLSNRFQFMRRLGAELEGLAEGDSCGLLVVDLDRFKEVNDTLGHHFGDEVLRRVSSRILHAVRDQDLVARLGGDEFAVMLSSIRESTALTIARRISTSCAAPMEIDGLRISVAASVGVAMAPRNGHEVEQLLRQADAAMYEAKRHGLAVRLVDPARDETRSRTKMTGEIGRAFLGSEFQLWCQPKVSLVTGAVIGAEALLRWHHPTKGVLTPQQFLDVLEVSSYHDQLMAFVLSEGASLAAALAAIDPELNLALNVSARSLCDDTLPERLDDLIERHQLAPNQLCLEITESHIMEDLAVTEPIISRLGELGISLSIDDFGTGYSSLARLQQLPVSEVKIDQSFVADLASSGNATIIVRSIIDLAHNLGLRTVAEGVEDDATRAILADLGCDAAQGYLFGRPVPSRELLTTLRAAASGSAAANSATTALLAG